MPETGLCWTNLSGLLVSEYLVQLEAAKVPVLTMSIWGTSPGTQSTHLFTHSSECYLIGLRIPQGLFKLFNYGWRFANKGP